VALGIKSWLTMGHSFGGLLQMGYVLRYPKSVRGMIMMCCSLNADQSYAGSYIPNALKVLEMDSSQLFTGTMNTMDKMGILIQKLQEKNVMWKLMYKSYDNFKKMGKTFAEVPNWNWGSEEYIVNTKDYHENFKTYCPKVKQPVLFFYGTEDLMVGPEHYKGMLFKK
jgi:proline iminopeptidase